MVQKQYVSAYGGRYLHPPAPKVVVPKWMSKNADVRKEVMGMSLLQATAMFIEHFGNKKAAKKADKDAMAMAIGYKVMLEEMEEAGTDTPDILYQRMEAAADADQAKMQELEIRFYKGGNEEMAAKKEEKKKGTISTLMLEILTAKSVPNDEAIIAKVKKAFPDSAFDKKHLAWYKSQVRQGKLKGQDGKAHDIKQAVDNKKRTNKKPIDKATQKKKKKKKAKK